jgi:hypothetical protein
VNRKFGWQAAAAELAEVVRIAGPRVALAAIVFLVVFAVPLVARYWAYFSRAGV